MSLVTVTLSMVAAASLTLALLHVLVWISDRKQTGHLVFSIMALSIVAIVPTEVGMMHSVTPQEYGQWVRWFHLPNFVLIVSLVAFVRLYLDAGRRWLAWTIVALRSVVLVVNFASSQPNFNWREITALKQLHFLGEDVSVVASAVTSPWQWLPTLSLLLFTIFVADATITLWRRGGADARRRAVLVGGSLLAFIVISIVSTQLIVWGVLHIPVIMTPTFMLPLLAMAFELSGELLRGAQVSADLRSAHATMNLAARTGQLALWCWDMRKNVVAEMHGRAMYGVPPDRTLSVQSLLDMIHSDDRPSVQQAIQDAIGSDGDFHSNYRIRLPGGAVRWIEARGKIEFDAARQPLRMVGITADVTERWQAEADARELRNQLSHASRVTMLSELSGSLAHELNQPLGAILRNAEAAELLLREMPPDIEELRAIVTDIRKDDERAGAVIDRMRGMLKRRGLEPQPGSVEGLVRDAVELARPDALARHIALDCCVDLDLPTVQGDRVQLCQVLLNLILNGMDAVVDAPNGRRHVLVDARRRDGQGIEVTVQDSGPGIAPELGEKIFDSFFTTKANGMGIGLAISRRIVEAHGGRLWAGNNPDGHGAFFRFTLPTQLS